MLKKFLIYSLIFGFVLTINGLTMIKLFNKSKKQIQIDKILTEISSINPQTQFQYSALPQVLGAYQTEVTLGDSRVANLKQFFRKYNSPLYDYADLIVQVSDQYQFDYRLLPAIAMQESNLCRYIPENSHNCWGWGIYGNNVIRFDSYEEAIKVVAKGIKENYLDHGLLTASAIMKKYTPSSKGSWAAGVNTFLRMLE